MKTNNKQKPQPTSVVRLAKELADKMPLVAAEDMDVVFENPAYREEIQSSDNPAHRKIMMHDLPVGTMTFADGKMPPDNGVWSRKNLRDATDANVLWQNDVVFVRRMKRWLVSQGFTFDSWCVNYYDPENKIVRAASSAPSIWISVSNKEKNLLCEIVHIHGKRGYLIRTRRQDNQFAPTENKVCETIIGAKNYIKSKYQKDDTDDLLASVL